MKYDDASWHYGGDFPKNLNDEAGATHIGMFVAWCFLNGLAGELYIDEFPDELESLSKREQTPGQWFIQNCDEKFTDQDLSDTGNSFAQFYYEAEDAPYFAIYEETLGQDVSNFYAVPDSWESYDKLASRIEEDFHSWRGNG